MQDGPHLTQTSLAGLKKGEWLEQFARISDEAGYVQPLGKRHLAGFIDEGPMLLVTFETIQGIQTLSEHAHPIGWSLVQSEGWSHLAIISDGDTWFRDERIFGYFDRLIDDGFFEDFEKVVFYGTGPCGYAAAAYSVAAPGAVVIALRPQATLDARVAEWDQRFFDKRRLNFTDRFGYAPDMLDAAEQAFIVYDPEQDYDAMHAALFTRSNVTKLRTRFLGDRIGEMLMGMGILEEILDAACEGQLTETVFNRLYRARRNYGPYLDVLLNVFDDGERPFLTAGMCKSVTDRMSMSNHRRRLKELAQSFKTAGEPLPFWQAKPTNATEVEGA